MLHVFTRLRMLALLLLGLVWLGGISSVRADATLAILHTFNPSTEGNEPEGGLVQGPDGSLYGVTYNGTNIAFQLTPDGTLRILHKFDTYSDGQQLFAKLLLVGNQLFGACAYGGGNDISQSNGTIFVIDLSKISPADNAAGFGLLHTFGDGGTPSDGSTPEGALTLAADGNIYGTTHDGGVAGVGTLFQLKPDSSGQFSYTLKHHIVGPDTYVFNGTYTKLYDFTGGTAGSAASYGGVIQGPGGFLYGTTDTGGSNNAGTAYKIARDGSGYTLLHAFTGGDGSGSRGELLFAVDGNLYGTTSGGGTGNSGTVFQLKPGVGGVFAANGPFQTIHNFAGANDGSQLFSGVIQASDGSLVGTTYSGGLSGSGGGTAFTISAVNGQFSSASPFSLLYSFTSTQSSPRTIFAPLIQGLDGRLYGESTRGGQLATSNSVGGTVFALDAGLEAPPIVGSVTGPGGSAVTTVDTSLVISGTHFASSFTNLPVVRVDGVPVTITARDYSQPIQKITVTLPASLSQGSHNATVGTSAPFAFSVGKGVAAPAITLLDYTPGQTKLSIHGSGFTSSDLINVTFVVPGGTITSFVVNDPTLATVTFSAPLPLGPHTVTVTDSDTQLSDSKLLVALGVSSADYTAGGSTLTLQGGGFAGSVNVSISNVTPGTLLAATVSNQHGTSQTYETLTITLTKKDNQGNPQPIALPSGDHTITLTNPQINAADVTNPAQRSTTYLLHVAQVAALPTITAVQVNQLTVLGITGANFVSGATVVVTNGTDGTVHTATVKFNSSTSLEADFSAAQALTAGLCVVTVTNPNGDYVNFLFNVPSITSIVYTPGSTSVVLKGVGFSANAAVSILNTTTGNGVAISGSVTVSDTGDQISIHLAAALAPSTNKFTVTNPDDQASATKSITIASKPVITGVVYRVTPTGSTVTINGSGFFGTPGVNLTVFNGTVLTLTSSTSTQLVITLNQRLPVGPNTATVKNPDGVTAQRGFTITAAPTVTPGGLTTFTNSNGTVLVVTGRNFVTTSDPAYPGFQVGATVSGTFLTASSAGSVTNNSEETVSQMVFELGHRFPHATRLTVVVRNPDGLATDGTVSAALSSRSTLRSSQSSSLPANTVRVFSAGNTSYQVSSSGGFFGWLLGLFGIHLSSSGGAATQVIASNSTALSSSKGVSITSVNGGIATGLISQDGAGLISQDGAGLISQDGAGLISQDGAGLISQDGAGVVSNDGGSLIASGGGNIAQHPSALASSAFSTAASARVTVFGLLGTVDDADANDNVLGFGSLSATAALKAQTAFQSRSAAVRANAAVGGASLNFQKTDQEGSTAPSDMTLTSLDNSGTSFDVLRMHFTPGERDLVLYVAPGFHLTPTNGTPAPVIAASRVTVTRGPLTSDHQTHQPYQVLTITNTGAATLSGPVLVALVGLPVGVTVSGPVGIVASSPAVTASTGALASGASVKVRIDFSNPANVRFSYGTAVYTGL